MQAYSEDLRERVLRATQRGESAIAIAERFEVSRQWVYQVQNRFKQEGIRHSFQIGGHRTSRLAPMEQQIRSWIQKKPDMTLLEMCERLSLHGLSIKASALWHQLNKWGLSFKKNAARQRTRARRHSNCPASVDSKPASA